MDSPGPTVVIGGGVLGLAVAVTLMERGLPVRLIDPGGVNASGVAAGMIAPAMESVLDDVAPTTALLLREAARLWPAFAERHGLDLRHLDTVYRGADAEAVASRLGALGFDAHRRNGDVVTPELRVDPAAAVPALRSRLGHPVPDLVRSIDPLAQGWLVRTEHEAFEAESLVLATGTAGALPGLPRSVVELLETVRPVRGQIGRISTGDGDAVLRSQDGYVVTSDDGVILGASMDEGRRDTEIDPVQSRELQTMAADLSGRPIHPDDVRWSVGVRGASPDGLPIAGRAAPGLFVALAPRRNGWLLAPAVGAVVADAIGGRQPTTFAQAFAPDRFRLSSY